MLKANGLWPQTSGVEDRGQTSAWQVASTLELPDDCGQRKSNLEAQMAMSALGLLLCAHPAQHSHMRLVKWPPQATPL